MFTKLILEDIKESLVGQKSRAMINLNCITCGIDYQKPKNYIQGKLSKGHKPLFCSIECANEPTKVSITPNCRNCGSKTVYPNIFCTQSCAAIFNNANRLITPKNCNKVKKLKTKKLIRNYCDFCKKECKTKFCTRDCVAKSKYEALKINWLNGELNVPNRRLRRYLTELFGYKCKICGVSEWNGAKITLEVEHVDGNSENSNVENVCLICPNCHSQTSTYKSKNKGNGRHFRRQRYKEGKSY